MIKIIFKAIVNSFIALALFIVISVYILVPFMFAANIYKNTLNADYAWGYGILAGFLWYAFWVFFVREFDKNTRPGGSK